MSPEYIDCSKCEHKVFQEGDRVNRFDKGRIRYHTRRDVENDEDGVTAVFYEHTGGNNYMVSGLHVKGEGHLCQHCTGHFSRKRNQRREKQ